MAGSKYLLGIIGGKEDTEGLGEFRFRCETFYLMFNCNVKWLIRTVGQLNEFELALDPEEQYLCLYFNPTAVQDTHNRARKRLIDCFFSPAIESSLQDLGAPACSLPPVPSGQDNDLEYDVLYERLRAEHLAENSTAFERNVQHTSLLPRLRRYQEEAVHFMIRRETEIKCLPSVYDKFLGNAVEDQDFYLNAYSMELTDVRPPDIQMPSGGILADEMGLGKTVEMLALILNNPSSLKKQTAIAEQIQPTSTPSGDDVKCMCSNSELPTGLIQCTKCKFYQHIKCVQMNRTSTSIETTENYKCPRCWLHSEGELVESGATIIVSPYTIRKQWETEIKKHIKDPSFKLLVYRGITRSKWISPLDLAQYDVVITDYNVFTSEIYFTKPNSRELVLRRERKHLTPTSPLTFVRWWRVCLDEAQMVESQTSKCTQMVKTLATVHRWAVTGTPIEKSINNLFGLLYFLDLVPYCEFSVWARLAEPFLRERNLEPLLDVLKRVMWRTCKRHVLDQIEIPPQTQQCHKITMSDVQMVFYREQHEICQRSFRERANKMFNSLKDTKMSKWDPHSLRLLLEPLRKLRQDCTVPSVIHKSLDQISKRLLSPDELYSHLLTSNEIQCKSHLRTIVSSLNGLAGIALLMNDAPLAAKYYKSVLKRAEENKNGQVTVDSLLQIHALENLIKIYQDNGDMKDVLEDYRDQLRALEAKYTENYYQVMKSAENQLNSAKQPTKIKHHQAMGHWWRSYMQKNQDIVHKINYDIQMLNFVNMVLERFQNIAGIDYVLTSWWDTVMKYRKQVHVAFEGLKFFTEKIRPGYFQTDQDKVEIQNLIRSASDCHLTTDEEEQSDDAGEEADDNYEPAPKTKRKLTCQLCEVKILLVEYECKIFDKTFNVDKKEGDGTWKPSYQEWIIRALQQAMKRSENTTDADEDDSNEIVQLIDKLKVEYKEFSKYWVEINYTASAYDELNMCKLQMSAVDPEMLRKGEKLKRHEISIHEIDLTQEELQTGLTAAEFDFLKSCRNLSYLKHLSANNELQSCPICGLKPEDKYSVWECGHQMCIPCLLKMKKFNGVNLACPVCRHNQKYQEINLVTLAKHNIKIEGRYSAKIIRILQEVQALKKEDADVKIIIFSQWDANLKVIEKALLDNKIAFRKKSNNFSDSVEDFKSSTKGVTCLLLPLSFGSKGLNLVEATHVFLVEPILNPSEELQAIGRVHRIGQTRPTMVHRFIVENTIEATIHTTVSNDSGKWKCKDINVENLLELFTLSETVASLEQ